MGRWEERTFWLQVTIDEAHQMQIFQRSRDFSCIEAGRVLVYALVRTSLEGSEKLTTTAVFHAEVEVVFGLE